MDDKERDRKHTVRRILDQGHDITERGSKGKVEGYGLCSRCSNFGYVRHFYGREGVSCESGYNNGRCRPSRENPITDCTDFYPVGQMSLRSMVEIATILDPKGPPRKIGFITDDDIYD